MSKPGLRPVRRVVAEGPGMPEATREFPEARVVELPGFGPEDVVALPGGGVVTGLADGRIVRVDVRGDGGARGGDGARGDLVRVVADTGGRPLGLEALEDGRVLVCDSRRGLLRVDLGTGAVETLVREVGGVPLRFCSNVAVQRDGTMWFTESTSRFDFETYRGAFLEHRPSGRLMRRDAGGQVEVILDELYFANGVTLLPDESALLFAETGGYSISRVPLNGTRAGQRDIVLGNLPGFPDNMSRFSGGRTWVAMTNPRLPALDRLGTSPGWVRQVVWRIPDRLQPHPEPIVWLMALDTSGQIVVDIHQRRDDFRMATGAAERDGRLYVASPECGGLLVIEIGAG